MMQQQVGWRLLSIKGAVPSPRSGHGLVSISSGRCVLFGGFDGKDCTNDLWVFDPDEERWMEIDSERSKVNRPSPRASHAMCACEGDTVFIWGGSGVRFGMSSLSDSFLFDLTTHEWTALSVQSGSTFSRCPYSSSRHDFEVSEKGPPARYGSACAFDSSTRCIVLFGGTEGTNYTNETWIYFLNERAWFLMKHCQAGSPPSPRYLARMACVGNSNFVLTGGGVPQNCFSSNPIDVHILDLRKLSWTLVIPMFQPPRARLAHAFTMLNSDQFVMYGGTARNSTAATAQIHAMLGSNIRTYEDSVMYRDGWVFSLSDMEWRALALNENDPDHPGPLDFVSIAATRQGNDVVLFGGFNKIQRSNRTHRLRLRYFVPSLEQFCVEQLRTMLRECPLSEEERLAVEDLLPPDVLNKVFTNLEEEM